MKSILFVMADMEVGGVERSALSLFQTLLSAGWEITLRMFSEGGALQNEIPSQVQIQTDSQTMQTERFRALFSTRLQHNGYRKLFVLIKKIYHLLGSFLIKPGKINESYDIVVAYQDGLPTWYVTKKIEAKKKIAFVHTDFKSAQYNSTLENQVYTSYDLVVFPSERARESFLSVVSFPVSNTFIYPNTIDADKIKILAQGDGFADDYNGIRILTVGRLSHEKGVAKIVPLLKRLREDGIAARWYLIGEGPMKEHIRLEAMKEKLTDSVVLLGKQSNPYPFLSQCDIYVQPSDYESYCIALAEACCLACPILACDFIGAREQISNGESGFIVGFSVDEMYHGLKMLAENRSLRQSFHNALVNIKPNNLFNKKEKFLIILEKMLNSEEYSCQ